MGWDMMMRDGEKGLYMCGMDIRYMRNTMNGSYEWLVDGRRSVPSMTQAPMKLYKSHSAVAGAENDELHSMVNNIIGTLKRTTLQKSTPSI